MFNSNAQGGIEYLLMIGAAILVVAIVIIGISGVIVETKDQNSQTDYNKQMDILDNLKKGGDSPIIISFLVEQTRGLIVANNINITLPSDSTLDISSLDPTINFRGVSVSPTGPQDFTNPVTYTVIGKDGSSEIYTVTISKEPSLPSSDKSILSFVFDSLSASGVVNESAKTILIEVPFGTSINVLSPSIQISPRATISPLPQVTQDFSNPITYRVTAEDSSFQDYIVSVNILEKGKEYILIHDCNELQNMSNDLTANYRLDGNIDCLNVSNFVPIGNGDSPFVGDFDGNNKVIYNLTINATSTQFVGLFGVLAGSVYNLGIVNASVDGLSQAGILAGMMTGSVSNCYSTGTVHGWISTGGLVAQSYGPVINSYSTATVSGSSFATGGLVGYMYVSDASVSNSYATGNVSGTEQVGGLVGSFNGTSSNSYATGNVSGNSKVGGLVGIQNANTSISNSYSIGTVSGNSSVGGLIGFQVAYGTKIVSQSFWDMNTSKQTTSSGGVGKLTSEMKNITTFSSWDSVIWEIIQGSYPNLVLFNDNPVWIDPTPPIPLLVWTTTYPPQNLAGATATCDNLGGRLPTMGEYCNNVSYHPDWFEFTAYWSSDQIVGIEPAKHSCWGSAPNPSSEFKFKCIPQ